MILQVDLKAVNPPEFAGGLYVIPGAVTPYPMKPRSDTTLLLVFDRSTYLPPHKEKTHEK